MQEHLKKLLAQLEVKYPKGSSTCSKSHLKMALYDWNKEKNWNNKNCFVYSFEDKGYIFYSFTTKEPKHCTIRHLFVLDRRVSVKLIHFVLFRGDRNLTGDET